MEIDEAQSTLLWVMQRILGDGCLARRQWSASKIRIYQSTQRALPIAKPLQKETICLRSVLQYLRRCRFEEIHVFERGRRHQPHAATRRRLSRDRPQPKPSHTVVEVRLDRFGPLMPFPHFSQACVCDSPAEMAEAPSIRVPIAARGEESVYASEAFVLASTVSDACCRVGLIISLPGPLLLNYSEGVLACFARRVDDVAQRGASLEGVVLHVPTPSVYGLEHQRVDDGHLKA